VTSAPDAVPVARSTEGPVWIPTPEDRVFAVTGADARDFLHRMLSQEVKGIAAGDGRPSLFLTVRGRIVGDPFVWNLPGGLFLSLDRQAAEKTIPALERYVIADDVGFRDVTTAWTTGIVADAPAGFAIAGVHAASFAFGTSPARRILGPATSAKAIEAALRAIGAREVEEGALRAFRVEVGAPSFGAELDDRILPNEAGLDASISWTKGCYLGQEPVVMAKHRGHPPTRLVRVELEGRDLPMFEAPLLDGGKPVGRVTTTARTADGARVRALGFVRWDLGTVGRALTLEGGRAARIEAVLA
jgi:folate-binding protein YgfZ